MKKVKHNDGFLGCRTTKKIEDEIKEICGLNKRDVSEVMNYLCRIFLEDLHGIKTAFLKAGAVKKAGKEGRGS